MLSLIRREPALATGFVLALIGVVAAFGLHVSDDQKAAIVSLVGSVLAILGAAHTRSKVSPAPKAQPTEAGHVNWLAVCAVLLLLILLALVGWLHVG